MPAAFFEEAAREHAAQLADLLIRKHRDYGPNNILACPVGPEQGLIVRISDKLARLGNLLKTGRKAENEPVRDSWSDIANYGLIGLMVDDGSFKLPLANSESPAQCVATLETMSGQTLRCRRRAGHSGPEPSDEHDFSVR